MASITRSLRTVVRMATAAAYTSALATAWASSGQIDNFSASTTTIHAGGTVDFTALFSINTSSWSDGGSNTTEPEPVEGYQTWNANWYSAVSESLSAVQLQAAGLSFNDAPGTTGGYANGWSFSVLFPQAGTYTIDLVGTWTTLTETTISTESASRTCTNNDPGGTNALVCDAWVWNYYDSTDPSSIESPFLSRSLVIEVTAVPEPEGYALMLGGLVLLAAVARRQWRN